RIDIQHLRPGGELRARVGFHTAEIAGRHLGGQDLAAGGIDALADHHEGALEADDDFTGGGADHGIGHDAILLVFGSVSRPGYQGTRPPSTPERSMISATLSSCLYAMRCTPLTPGSVRISWMRSMQSWRPSRAPSVAPAMRFTMASGMWRPGTCVRIHSA